jgi:hypothetical protein
MNLHAIAQMQLRGRRRVDGVGRLKFDSTQVARRVPVVRLHVDLRLRPEQCGPPLWSCRGTERPAVGDGRPGAVGHGRRVPLLLFGSYLHDACRWEIWAFSKNSV